MNILIDMPVYEPLLTDLKSMHNINVDIVDKPEEKSRILPKEKIEDCDILFCTVPPKNHRSMSRLKIIQISSAGYSQVVGEGFDKRGVRVCNARGVFDIPIAEWNIAMMINLYRDLRSLIRNQEQGIWDRSSRFQREIRGSVVGIWGYGGIARETSRLAKTLGIKIHTLIRNEIHQRKNIYSVPGTGDVDGTLPDHVFLLDEKMEFLNSLDFLVMAIPLTESTRGILGKEELKVIPQHAYLLNPARGPLIQEKPLLKAIREGWIAGAALDTHYHYPMPNDHPLWSMPNVIMTPHISGSSSSTNFLKRVYNIFLQNIIRFQQDKPLLNELSPTQIKGN